MILVDSILLCVVGFENGGIKVGFVVRALFTNITEAITDY